LPILKRREEFLAIFRIEVDIQSLDDAVRLCEHLNRWNRLPLALVVVRVTPFGLGYPRGIYIIKNFAIQGASWAIREKGSLRVAKTQNL
jgi:hypothetical protein